MSLSQQIVSKARSIGLNVDPVIETPGDGNCFYHAVIQTLSLTNRPYAKNVDELRYDVVSYVDFNRNNEIVISYLESFLNPVGIDLENIIQAQYRRGTYADELFFQAAAEKLNILILITKADSTAAYPYTKFWPLNYRSTNIQVSQFTGTKILLGHCNEHFQSLRLKNLEDHINIHQHFLDEIPLKINLKKIDFKQILIIKTTYL